MQGIAEYPKLVGSPYWMPPETIHCAPQTKKADVWSLGCTLFQMIDVRSFELGNAPKTLFTVATEGREWQIKDNVMCSKKMKSFLKLCLKTDPKERPDIKDLLEHPFLAEAPSKDCLSLLIDTYICNASLLR